MATIDASTLLSGNLCTDIGSLLISAPGFDPAPSITFTEEHVGMEFDVTVQDPNGINSCWGTVLVEDKLAPIIMCPADEIVLCTMPTDTAATGIPILLSARGMYTDLQTATISNGLCEAELFFRDAVLNNLCNGIYQQVISRTFYAVDNAGNMSEPCVQTISVEREILDNATYPPHWDGLATHIGIEDNGVLSNPPLACEGVGTAWAADTLEDGRIVPSPFDQGLIPGTGAPGDVDHVELSFHFTKIST